MRISPLTETDLGGILVIAKQLERSSIQIHITTTELSYALGVSQDTIKRRLNRERQRWADFDALETIQSPEPEWCGKDLPEPYGENWRTRPAEWDLVVVLRWLAQRPMRRQV